MKIQIERNPLDVKIFDDEGRELNLKIRAMNIDLVGGSIPTATLQLELWDNWEIVVGEFDLAAAGIALMEGAERSDEKEVQYGQSFPTGGC
jgi:hypothetical protein